MTGTFETGEPETTFTPDSGPSDFYPEYNGMPVAKLGTILEALEADINSREEALKALKARSEHLKIHRIPKALEDEGLRNIRLSSGRGVTVENRLHVSVLASNREAFHEWLRMSGNDSLISETVHPMTLKSFMKRQIADAAEFPADLISYSIIPTAKFFGARS